jgi:hypothetical protein
LEKKGFYIARHATANYCQTRLCLSCSLNGVYLDEMVRGLDRDQTQTSQWMGRNAVVEALRPIGYKFVAFSSGFDDTDHPDCDDYLTPHALPFTGFQRLLITTTPFGSMLPVPRHFNRFQIIRDRVLYQLNHLPEVADDPASTFTFAHFMCPHPPFLFGQDGEDVEFRDKDAYDTEWKRFDGLPNDKRVYYRGYRDQAIFITKRIEQVIDQILERSESPPIILLQADHGSGLNLDMERLEGTDLLERMTILNAYYFPDKRYEKLYDTISPVNSFRVVMNTFFGASLDLLPDRSYFSTWKEPFQFHDVTAQVAGKDYKASPTDSKRPDASDAPRPPETRSAPVRNRADELPPTEVQKGRNARGDHPQTGE